ncbi:uncharacterized protein EDB91DRAFT_1152981, partial [Suillus paluster]|uniref:uncharacterized protein n=1 Tax=Suillus paluster TaxID=48578 RepID=UPI001B868682
ALELRPPDHPRRPSSLNNLVNSLRDRFLQRGILTDLDDAIELHRVDAIGATQALPHLTSQNARREQKIEHWRTEGN